MKKELKMQFTVQQENQLKVCLDTIYFAKIYC